MSQTDSLTAQATTEKNLILGIHLGQFLGYAAPVLGWVVPLAIWLAKREEMPALDPHGKAVANWMLSELIYATVFIILAFFLVGIPLLFVLGILSVVFPVVGAVKASSGEVWKYPLSIPFFR